MSPRKFPDAEESRESRLSSRVFKVILKPFCCFVRFDYKVKDTERCVWKDVRRLVKTRAKGQSRGHERASEQLQRSMYAGEMKLVFVRINGHQKPHPLACDGIVNADGSISHVWIEKQTLTHIHSRWWSQIRELSSPERVLNRQEETHPWRGQSAKKLKYNIVAPSVRRLQITALEKNSWVQRHDPSSERRKAGIPS